MCRVSSQNAGQSMAEESQAAIGFASQFGCPMVIRNRPEMPQQRLRAAA
jgi:hypothetical protein